jgi:hypothetical protein
VVEYEALCADPVGAAGALLSRLPELRAVEPDAARAAVRTPLRHFRATAADLETQGAGRDVVDLYRQLRGQAIHPSTAAREVLGALANDQLTEAILGIPAAVAGLDLAIRDVHVDLQRLAAVVSRLQDAIGFIRSDDLAGVATQLEVQRHNVYLLTAAVERLAEAVPAPGEAASAVAMLDASANGARHD